MAGISTSLNSEGVCWLAKSNESVVARVGLGGSPTLAGHDYTRAEGRLDQLCWSGPPG